MKTLFVHIPKTAGQSIFSIIDDNWRRTFPFKHDPLFNLQLVNEIPEDVFKFCVVRNPFTRIYSYYRHFLIENGLEFTFEEFLSVIKNKINYRKTPMLLYPQSFYVYDLETQISLNIFKYEKLHKLERVLECKIPFLNKGSYKESEYYQAYTPQNRDMVKRLFECDFDTFDYSMDMI